MDESLKMKHFDHPNVLGLIGVCLDAGPAPYVVMPYMANGSLLQYLKKERSTIVLTQEVDDDVVRFGTTEAHNFGVWVVICKGYVRSEFWSLGCNV